MRIIEVRGMATECGFSNGVQVVNPDVQHVLTRLYMLSSCAYDNVGFQGTRSWKLPLWEFSPMEQEAAYLWLLAD